MFSNIFNAGSTQNTQQQGSLFSNPSAPSMFNNTQQQQPQAQGFGGGGLFGSKPASNPTGSSLFGNLLGSNPQQQQPQASGTLFNNASGAPTGGGLFGGMGTASTGSTAPGGGLFGGSAFGTTNPQQPTPLFGSNPQNTNPTGGTLFQNTQQPQNNAGGSMFGGLSNPVGTGQSTGLFGMGQPNNNAGNSLFGNSVPTGNTNNFGSALGGAGGGLSTSPSFGIGAGNNTGMMGAQPMNGSLGTPFDRNQTKRSHENVWVQSINAMQVYKDKNLMEIRLEDYKSIQQGRLPDEMKMLLQSGQSLANYQPKAGGGFNLNQSTNSSTGFGGLLIGSNSQSQPSTGGFFGGAGGSLMKPATQTGGGIFGQNTQSSFFGSQPNTQNTTTPAFGGASTAFGQPTQPATSGIFGASNFSSTTSNLTANKPGGLGLFGTTQTGSATGGGLFSTGTTNPNPLGGITTNTQGGGLFSQPQATQPSFFGTQPQQQPGQFGLATKPPEQQQTGGGLFSNLTTPASGGLFSQQPTGQPNSSMFGATQPLLGSGGFTQTWNNGQQNPAQPQMNMGGVNLGQMSTPNNGGNLVGTGQQIMGQFTPMDMNSGLLMNNTPGNLGGGGLFSASPAQNNWYYHDWTKEYQNFYGNSYEAKDDFGYFPFIPYKRNASMIRTPQQYANFAITKSKSNAGNFENNEPFIKKTLNIEKRPSQEFDRKYPPRDLVDREPSVIGYQNLNLVGPTAGPNKNITGQEDEKKGVLSDRAKIQELLSTTIKLKVELKGPKQGVFTVECEPDVTISEMKTQILEILEKSFQKPFLTQEKYYKIAVNHAEKGMIILNENYTIEEYRLKSSSTIMLIKDLNIDENEMSEERFQINRYPNQLAPEKMIPILTRPGYFTVPSMKQLSRMNEDQLRRVENFTIQNEFATIQFEGFTDVRHLNLDRIVNLSFRSVELYPDEIYNEENKPSLGKELNKPAIIIFHKFKIEENERVTREKILKKVKKWAKKSRMEFINFDFEHGNLTTRVQKF